MKINYDELDETYERLPSRTRIGKPTAPQGSRTDNARVFEPRVNAWKNRVRHTIPPRQP